MSNNKRTIEFTKAFAGKKKGDELKCDSLLASTLVHKDKVAVYTGESLELYDKALEVAVKAKEEVAKAKGKIASKIDALKDAAKKVTDSLKGKTPEELEEEKIAEEIRKEEEANK